MDKRTKDTLISMGQQEKQFDGLYRAVASAFGFPDCSMWILYDLFMEDAPLTQHDLIDRMVYSKQTIHSAVSWLAKKEWVRLETNPASRSSKFIHLTGEGKRIAEESVGLLLSAEEEAVEAMGAEKMRQYIALHQELICHLLQALRSRDLLQEKP